MLRLGHVVLISVLSYAEHHLYIQSCSIKKKTHTPEYVNDGAMHGICSTRALLITICRPALLLLHKQTRFAHATTTFISSLNYLLVSSTQQSSSLQEAKITLQHEIRLWENPFDDTAFSSYSKSVPPYCPPREVLCKRELGSNDSNDWHHHLNLIIWRSHKLLWEWGNGFSVNSRWVVMQLI